VVNIAFFMIFAVFDLLVCINRSFITFIFAVLLPCLSRHILSFSISLMCEHVDVLLGPSIGFFLLVDKHSWKMVLKVLICWVIFFGVLQCTGL